MIWAQRIGSLAFGLAVGGIGTWFVGSDAPVSAPPPPQQTVDAREIRLAPDCEGDGDLVERLQTLRSELAAAELTVKVGNAQEEAEYGAPLPWPEDLPEEFTEAGLERELNAMLDEIGGGELIGLDCGEYPCTGVVVVSGEHTFPLRDAFGELMRSSRYSNFHKSEGMRMTDEGAAISGLILQLAFPAEKLEDGQSKRVGFLVKEVGRTFNDEVTDALNAADEL